jgi:hypothetical protein
MRRLNVLPLQVFQSLAFIWVIEPKKIKAIKSAIGPAFSGCLLFLNAAARRILRPADLMVAAKLTFLRP